MNCSFGPVKHDGVGSSGFSVCKCKCVVQGQVVVQINRTDLTSQRSWRRSRRRCPAGSPGSATVRPGSAPCHTHHTGGGAQTQNAQTWNISL